MAEATGILVAVSGAAGGILTALGTWAYNMRKATGENRVADGNAAKAQGDAVTAMSAAAASWMEKYADLMGKYGAVMEKLSSLESAVVEQGHKLETLQRDFDAATGNLQTCQDENVRLTGELGEAHENVIFLLNGFNAARQILNLRDEDDEKRRGSEYEFMAQATILETMTHIEKRGMALV